jgi:hypothetical protein
VNTGKRKLVITDLGFQFFIYTFYPLAASSETIGMDFHPLRIQLPSNKEVPHHQGPVKLSLRPEILHIRAEDSPGNALKGIVSQSAYMGPVFEYTIDTSAGSLFTRAPAYHEQYRPKDKVFVHIRPEELIVYPMRAVNETPSPFLFTRRSIQTS